MAVDLSKLVDLERLKEEQGIEHGMIATVESTSTASKAYAIGDRFYFKGKLCICTADIASGGTITLNTNCKLDVLGDDVSELKTALFVNNGIKWNKGLLYATGGINTSGNGGLTDPIEIKGYNTKMRCLADNHCNVAFWNESVYLGKIAQDGSINKASGATNWKSFKGEFDISPYIPQNATHFKIALTCNDGTTVTTENVTAWANSVFYIEDRIGKIEADVAEVEKIGELAVKAYGVRVTASNYSTVLPDLNNATPNIIYDIHTALHSIANIPTDIPDTLASATFYSIKGDTINSNNWVVQYLIPNGNVTRVFVRNYMDGSWKPWKELAGTVADANVLSLDYYNATCVNKLEIPTLDSTANILCFGDSITAGNTDTSWTYHFADMTGATIVNKAVAGATFGESTSELWISTQISGVSTSEWNDADLIIVSAGTNDGVHNTPDDELATKVQAAITSIREETNKPIVFITPIRRNTPSYSENIKLPYIAGIITNIAVSNECNVICGYTFPIASETNGEITNLTSDGLHPNATGANVYARSVINALL